MCFGAKGHMDYWRGSMSFPEDVLLTPPQTLVTQTRGQEATRPGRGISGGLLQDRGTCTSLLS